MALEISTPQPHGSIYTYNGYKTPTHHCRWICKPCRWWNTEQPHPWETTRTSGPVHTYPEIFLSANFFTRIQNYLRPHVAYTNRIRPSTRIRFVSGHLKGLVNRARAEKDWFWYCDVNVFKNIRIRASTRIRIQNVYRNLRHVWTLGVSA